MAGIESWAQDRLTPGDVSRMRERNALFALVFDDPKTYGSEPPSDAYLSQLLAKDHFIALVALAAGRVVGGLVAYELEKFEALRLPSAQIAKTGADPFGMRLLRNVRDAFTKQ